MKQLTHVGGTPSALYRLAVDQYMCAYMYAFCSLILRTKSMRTISRQLGMFFSDTSLTRMATAYCSADHVSPYDTSRRYAPPTGSRQLIRGELVVKSP